MLASSSSWSGASPRPSTALNPIARLLEAKRLSDVALRAGASCYCRFDKCQMNRNKYSRCRMYYTHLYSLSLSRFPSTWWNHDSWLGGFGFFGSWRSHSSVHALGWGHVVHLLAAWFLDSLLGDLFYFLSSGSQTAASQTDGQRNLSDPWALTTTASTLYIHPRHLSPSLYFKLQRVRYSGLCGF